MSRRFCLALAASFSLAAFNLAPAQTDPATTADVAKLQAENATLKKEVSDAQATIAKLQAQLAQGTTPAPAATDAATPPAGPMKALPLDAPNPALTTSTPAAPGAPGAPAADAGPGKTYTVVKGDSLWKIAHKMYPGDTKNGVDKLNEANKDAIGGKPLKIGQVLVVPQ